MKPFTAAPLTAKTVAARLSRYNFWSRGSLDLAVARNAVEAIKSVARGSLAIHESPQTLRGVIRAADPQEFGDLTSRVYKHGPVRAHLADLWPELLVEPPEPPFETTLQLLRELLSTSRVEGLAALAAVLRKETAHLRFDNGARLVGLAPKLSPIRVCAPPLLLSGLATASFACWSAAPIVAFGIGAFWLGLAANSVRLPKYPGVFCTPRLSRVEQLRSTDKLRLASALVTAFEELGPVNVTSYHWRPHTDESMDRLHERSLVNWLRSEGIEPLLSSSATLYADYWSEHHALWSSVEWSEPDQDPAVLIVRQALAEKYGEAPCD